MKKYTLTPARRGALLALSVLSLSAGASWLPALTPAAQAKPKQMLELWPGQRVLLVLPLMIGPDWNGGPELAEAVKPLVRPYVQSALSDTGKFSITLPYRFDPILRRAVVENRISQDIITPFVNTPTLATAQPVFSQLKFEQVPMVAEIQLEEIRVGGTPKTPTVQLQMSGKLYEIGGSAPFRTVVVTSDAMPGRTPEERLQKAAANGAQQIAAFFVKPPESFQLPDSLIVKEEPVEAPPVKPVKPTATKTPAPKPQSGGNSNGNSNAAMPVIPMLPPTQPPLGVDPGGEKALGR